MIRNIEKFKEQLNDSQKIVFFGGAGVSTESGIPDFRSAEGLYLDQTNSIHSAEEMISNTFYKNYPKEFFSYYFKNLVYKDAKPNMAHLFLKDLENEGKDIRIVTQNIDGLHQKAGSKVVHELHGSVLRNYCTKCSMSYKLSELTLDEAGIPRCKNDNAIVRPDVVLYEESLNQNTLKNAIYDIKTADMLIIAGTSLVVYPAAGLINYFSREYLVAINKTPISAPKGTLMFEESLSNIFSKLQ